MGIIFLFARSSKNIYIDFIKIKTDMFNIRTKNNLTILNLHVCHNYLIIKE